MAFVTDKCLIFPLSRDFSGGKVKKRQYDENSSIFHWFQEKIFVLEKSFLVTPSSATKTWVTRAVESTKICVPFDKAHYSLYSKLYFGFSVVGPWNFVTHKIKAQAISRKKFLQATEFLAKVKNKLPNCKSLVENW